MSRPTLLVAALAATLLSSCAAQPPSAPVALAAITTLTPAPAQTAGPTARPTQRPTAVPTPAPVFGTAPTGPTQVATVVGVTDGDTIRVNIGGTEHKVRYIGMNTPEIHNGLEWMGPEASAANAALVAGKQVVLEKDVSETDQYGRLLRYVWLPQGSGWLLVNLELIRLGFAAVSTYPPDVKYTDALYVAAQRQAQSAGVGLWAAAPTPVPQPALFFAPPPPPAGACDPSYPTVCIPPAPPDLNCGDITFRRFTVLPPDPHGFDGDHDGIGCES